ncbi:MAG: hypothetical protein IPL53_03965 [Ignavibacteria bacterium]|nr:hypothetical protein [Ignavibacteria bacterium]
MNLNEARNLLPQDLIDKIFSIGLSFELKDLKLQEIGGFIDGVRLPIGSTGLVITKIDANISNITEGYDIKIIVTCDIETGVPAIKLDGMGGELVPSTYIALRGGVTIFDKKILNAEVKGKLCRKKNI